MQDIVQLVTAFTGSLGFAILFHVSRDKLFLSGFGGFLSWGIYLFMGNFMTSDVPRFFVATIGLTIYAEILARVVKCPATLFLVTAAIPLIPGGALYRTMRYFMLGQYAEGSHEGLITVLLAVAIAVGMLFPMSFFQLIRRIQAELHHNQARHK